MKSILALSAITSLMLLGGCSAPKPEGLPDVHLTASPDGNISLEENNATANVDQNLTDAKRYKMDFEAPPLSGTVQPGDLIKRQPVYPQPQVADTPIIPLTIDDKRPVRFSVQNIPVGKFAEAALGGVLSINYTITPDAAAKSNPVSLNMSQPSKGEDFFAVVQKILNDNGLKLSREGNILFVSVIPPKVQPVFNPGVQDTVIYYGRELPDNLPDFKQITVFVPYFYADMMQQMANIKNYALSPNAQFQVMDMQKTVMIKDLAGNIKKALIYIDLFDRSIMKNKTAQIIPLHYVSPKNLAERLKEILPSVGVPVAKKNSDLGLFVLELPELQSLLVISDKNEWIDQVVYWRDKLDNLNALGDSPRMFVYQVKNRKATELMSLTMGTATTTTQQTNNTSGGAGGGGDNAIVAPKTSTTSALVAGSTGTNNSMLGDTRILADTNTNSLIIYATPERYREIERILQTIDILPRQVMVEVTIAELTLKDSLKYGLEWYLQSQGNKYTGTIQTLGNLGLGGGGLTGSILKNSGDFSAMINMFAEKSLINILSSPKIVVLNNQAAMINVGTEVPVLTSQTTSTTTGTTNTSTQQSVQYRTTGIILNVTPTVNSGGVLTLKIDQQVSEAQTNALSSISSPLILNRAITTNVVLQSGESVLLGGLISTNRSDGNTHVPLFGDIPLLGNLFKTTSNSVTKTELIVMVKPVILENGADHIAITKAIRTVNLDKNDQI